MHDDPTPATIDQVAAAMNRLQQSKKREPSFNERFNLTPPSPEERMAAQRYGALLSQIEQDMLELQDLAAIAPDRCYYPADDEHSPVQEQGSIDEDPFEPLPENVELGPMTTKLPVSSARYLRHAHECNLKEIIILGCTDDDSEYMSANLPDRADILWHLERAKHKLLTMTAQTLLDGDEPQPPKESA